MSIIPVLRQGPRAFYPLCLDNHGETSEQKNRGIDSTQAECPTEMKLNVLDFQCR